jgi:hypothetical protein
MATLNLVGSSAKFRALLDNVDIAASQLVDRRAGRSGQSAGIAAYYAD